MPTTSTVQRRLRAVVIVLVSTLVILSSSAASVSAPDTFPGPVKGNSLPLELRDCTTSSPSRRHLPDRLTRGGAPRGYGKLIGQGDHYLHTITAAFAGRYPGKEFAPTELENGWTKSTTLDETDLGGVEFRWKAAFESLFGRSKGYPPPSQIKSISLVQDKPYTTFLGKRVNKPTNAYSDGLYYPTYALIMSTMSYSAAMRLQDRNPAITNEDRDKRLPTISTLADLMWLAWNTVSPNPKALRYLARDKIFNEETLTVMDYLFLRDRKDTRNVPWPGLAYRGDSDEGKALLATPNGRATAWLLIDHAPEMKGPGEIGLRELRVRIFAVAGDYCMLWDLEPQSPA
ncbi:MAG: hypothetical protein Q9196_003914 [Gyalolechia fulgens]